ncbi:MAG: hypothetical protein U5Q44_05195 [Dehalococcoidia bacterium]|nr:hypothetical protein [Dehalococcoidia bacterium]
MDGREAIVVEGAEVISGSSAATLCSSMARAAQTTRRSSGISSGVAGRVSIMGASRGKDSVRGQGLHQALTGTAAD